MANPYTSGKKVPKATSDLEGFVIHVVGLGKEEDRLATAMKDKDTIAILLSNPGAFERIRAKLTGFNRQFYELLLLDMQDRVKWLTTALCQLKDVHMALLSVVLPVQEMVPILYLKAKPEAMGGCGDKIAQEMFQQVLFGDKEMVMPEEGKGPSPRMMGLWGLWQNEYNPIAGEIIMRLGDNVFVDPPRPFLTEADYTARGLEYQKKKLAEAPIMAACPVCRKFAPQFMRTIEGGQVPTGEFVRVMEKETGREALRCVNCALAQQKEGKIDILEPIKKSMEEAAAVVAQAPEVPGTPPPAAALKPVASFITDKKTGVAPLPVRFTDTSTNLPTHWEWDFGDGTPKSEEKNPIHLYQKAGTYSVTVVVSNTAGVSFAMQPNLITVSAPAPVKEGAKPMVQAPTKVVLPKETPLAEKPPVEKPLQPFMFKKAVVAGQDKWGTVDVLGFTGEYNYVKVKLKDGSKKIVPDVLLSEPYEEGPPIEESLAAIKAMAPEFKKEAAQIAKELGIPAREAPVMHGTPGTYKARFWYSPSPVGAYRGSDPGISLIDFGEDSDVTPDEILWEFGDGTTDRTLNRYPVHIYEKPGKYQVKMTVWKDGKYATYSQEVDVPPRPAETVRPQAPAPERITEVPARAKVPLSAEQKRRLLERAVKEMKLPQDRLLRLIEEQDIPEEIYRQFGIVVEVSPGTPENPRT